MDLKLLGFVVDIISENLTLNQGHKSGQQRYALFWTHSKLQPSGQCLNTDIFLRSEYHLEQFQCEKYICNKRSFISKMFFPSYGL